MIQLHVADTSSEGQYSVVQVIGCSLKREALFCASYVMSRQ
jgi:hypothetical protein